MELSCIGSRRARRSYGYYYAIFDKMLFGACRSMVEISGAKSWIAVDIIIAYVHHPVGKMVVFGGKALPFAKLSVSLLYNYSDVLLYDI